MNGNLRWLPVFCAVAISMWNSPSTASAQRIRFGSGIHDPARADGGISVASRPIATSSDPFLSSLGTTTSAPPITPIPPAEPAYSPTVSSPILGTPTWDPYQVASRPARFTGLVAPLPTAGGLPQPMPRVPYYTQQPVVSTSQPYVVIPETAAPVAPAPIAPAPGTVVLPGATPPGMVVPSTVPTLGSLTAPPPPGIGGRCYGYADAIFFTRDAEIGNNLLVFDFGAPNLNDAMALTTADMGFGFEVGPRITLGREFDGFRAIEATYFGIYNFQNEFDFAGPGLFVIVPGAGYDGFVDQVSVDYDSQVQNAEINYLQHYGNVAWLAGFRYFMLGEKFSIQSSEAGIAFSDSRVSIYNNLFGAQLGGRISQACGRWSYDLTGKAGVYANSIHTSQLSSLEGMTLIDQKTTGSRVSFIGELGLNGNYELNPNWLIRGGYQVYWIEGVGLATNQINYGGGAPSLNKNGGVFMHGAHAGLMARW